MIMLDLEVFEHPELAQGVCIIIWCGFPHKLVLQRKKDHQVRVPLILCFEPENTDDCIDFQVNKSREVSWFTHITGDLDIWPLY